MANYTQNYSQWNTGQNYAGNYQTNQQGNRNPTTFQAHAGQQQQYRPQQMGYQGQPQGQNMNPQGNYPNQQWQTSNQGQVFSIGGGGQSNAAPQQYNKPSQGGTFQAAPPNQGNIQGHNTLPNQGAQGNMAQQNYNTQPAQFQSGPQNQGYNTTPYPGPQVGGGQQKYNTQPPNQANPQGYNTTPTPGIQANGTQQGYNNQPVPYQTGPENQGDPKGPMTAPQQPKPDFGYDNQAYVGDKSAKPKGLPYDGSTLITVYGFSKTLEEVTKEVIGSAKATKIKKAKEKQLEEPDVVEEHFRKSFHKRKAKSQISDGEPDEVNPSRDEILETLNKYRLVKQVKRVKRPYMLSLVQRKDVLEAIDAKMQDKREYHESEGQTSKRNYIRKKLNKGWQVPGLWSGHLTKIEGRFGTGVTSYFRFLRLLFYLNLPVFLIYFIFLYIPQIILGFDVSQEDFSGWDILTGEGALRQLGLYYGNYEANYTFQFNNSVLTAVISDSTVAYNMQYAYLLTNGSCYLLTLLILAISFSKSYRLTTKSTKGHSNFASKVLTKWRFNITSQQRLRSHSIDIFKDLQECLTETTQKAPRTNTANMISFCKVLAKICGNIICLAFIGGTGLLIFLGLGDLTTQEGEDVFELLTFPLIITAINFVLPMFFAYITIVEMYKNPRNTVYVTILRTITLVGVTMGLFMYFWISALACENNSVNFGGIIAGIIGDDPNAGNVTGASNNQTATTTDQTPEAMNQTAANCDNPPCWENTIGATIYRLVIMEFFFSLLFTFYSEVLKGCCISCCVRCCCCTCGNRGRDQGPEFNVARNTLYLIYSQALVWLGMYYCPVVSLIMVVKIVLLFYIKRFTVMRFCIPSAKLWKTGRTETIFVALLCFMCILCFIAVAYPLLTIFPSVECGPFQKMTSIFDAIVLIKADLEETEVLNVILQFIFSTGFIAAILIVLICIAYHLRVKVVAQQTAMDQMKRKEKKIVQDMKNTQQLHKLLQSDLNARRTTKRRH